MGSASLPELGFIPKTPSPGQHRRSVSDAVLAVSLTECFFTTHTPCRQSCCGNRIAPPNPAVATGLLHPILLWQQDCSTQSCYSNRIAPVFRAVLYSTTPPDSPPGLRGKHRQCVGTHRCTPGLAARIARKTTEAHCCIAGRSRKTLSASCCVAVR